MAYRTYLKQTLCVMLIAIFGAGNVMATEEAEYTLVLKEADFEVREPTV